MATPVKAPPKPTRDPDIHLKNGAAKRKPPRTLKGDIRKLRGKVSSARTKWAEGRQGSVEKQAEIRREADEILAPTREKVSREKKLAGEVVKPVLAAVTAVKAGLDPKNGKTRPYVTSFMISSAVSWAVGPQILTAAYERIRFHTSTTDWGVMHGPGRWFRDTLRMARETGQVASLVWSIAIGLMPMIVLSVRNAVARYVAQGAYRGRFSESGVKWLSRSAYLVPIGFFVGIPYPAQTEWLLGVHWGFDWWQFWVAGLFCAAYYCTMWVFDRVEKGLGLGYFHVLLMVPLASIVTGFALDAPGAAW